MKLVKYSSRQMLEEYYWNINISSNIVSSKAI